MSRRPGAGRPAAAGRRPSVRAVGSERFAARSRRRIWRRVLGGLVAAVAAGAVGGAVWLVGWSDVTALDDVRVTGARGPLREAVAAAAPAPIGTPLIRVDTERMAAAAREVPAVESAAARRSWPDAVVIDVTPRTPAAAVPDGSSWWLVDRHGVLFGESSRQPEGLPVLDAPADADAAAARAAGVAVLGGLPDDLRASVAEVVALTPASVELALDGGATVVWGTADRTARKAEVLRALLDSVDEPASVYDVSAPSSPAVRP